MTQIKSKEPKPSTSTVCASDNAGSIGKFNELQFIYCLCQMVHLELNTVNTLQLCIFVQNICHEALVDKVNMRQSTIKLYAN